ncbi:MAG: B12-binding domain-containing radical SAM protein, partial [Elusimicrobia bacterium]|nr:B12-binding domain-containing radical SAM protein [Elusimicrobiota bacterium]
MAKTVLINPGSECEIYSATEPLNLGFIAGYLEKNGVEVRIIDEMANENPIKMINELKPDMVGITATTPLVTRAYEIADYCRDRKILTIMGGVHASVLSEEALKHCDIVVKGEGEQAILDIVKNGMRQKIVSMPYIKNLDEIPPPARHLFKMNFYLKSGERLPTHTYNFAPKGSNTAALMCSRGCPYNCTFCHNSWREMPFRFNSAERVISEIKSLIERYNVNAIFFLDDDMFANNPRLKKICETIIKEKFNILWSCAARSNNLSSEILELARESGCVKINFGFESGSQKILNVLNKKNTLEENQKAIDLCRKAKIEPCGSFMIGNPTETMEDINLTRQFIRRSKLKYKSILITTPFPGTKLWE